MITEKNYETYLLLFIDKELNEAQEKELMAYIEKHPELKKELLWYQKTVLPQDEETCFADKNVLFKKETKTLAFSRWWAYGAAAGLILLVIFSVSKWTQQPTHKNENIVLEKTPPVKTPDSNKQEFIAKEENTPPQNKTPELVIAQKTKPEKPQKNAVSPASVNLAPKKTPTKKDAIAKKENEENKPAVGEILQKENEAVVNNEYPQTEEIKNAEATANPGKNLIASIASEKKRIQFTIENQQGIQHLKKAVEEKIETVKAINENIKNTSLALKVGKKELLVIHL